LDSLLAVPSCNPLHICFFNPKFGPHWRKWDQQIAFWQQLHQHGVFALVLVCSPFPVSVQLQGVKGRRSRLATKTRGKVLPWAVTSPPSRACTASSPSSGPVGSTERGQFDAGCSAQWWHILVTCHMPASWCPFLTMDPVWPRSHLKMLLANRNKKKGEKFTGEWFRRRKPVNHRLP